MNKQIIEFADGVMVEIETDTPTPQTKEKLPYQDKSAKNEQMWGKNAPDLHKSLNINWAELLDKSITTIVNAINKPFQSLNKKLGTTSASVSFSLKFTGEGKIIIASGKASGQMQITFNWDYSKQQEK